MSCEQGFHVVGCHSQRRMALWMNEPFDSCVIQTKVEPNHRTDVVVGVSGGTSGERPCCIHHDHDERKEIVRKVINHLRVHTNSINLLVHILCFYQAQNSLQLPFQRPTCTAVTKESAMKINEKVFMGDKRASAFVCWASRPILLAYPMCWVNNVVQAQKAIQLSR